MGENGAGKSTLIKVLTGVYDTDAGAITLDGEPVRVQQARCRPSRPASAPSTRRSTSAPTSRWRRTSSSAASPAGSARSSWREMRRRAAELLARLDLDIDVTAPLATYSLAIQQMVAIAPARSTSRPGC